MSSTGKNISSALIDGIYAVLNGNVTVSSVTYKVLKEQRRDATNRAYVWIGNVIDVENGTKDDFIYDGSIVIESVDERQVYNTARATAQSISDKVRSLLQTSKGSTFSVTGFTLTYFRHGSSRELYEQTRDKRERVRIIDIFEFQIQ